jgi:hypothetical protein
VSELLAVLLLASVELSELLAVLLDVLVLSVVFALPDTVALSAAFVLLPDNVALSVVLTELLAARLLSLLLLLLLLLLLGATALSELRAFPDALLSDPLAALDLLADDCTVCCGAVVLASAASWRLILVLAVLLSAASISSALRGLTLSTPSGMFVALPSSPIA